ncbi:uncharacterized protein Z520_01504 [Fonsecaea multimorphosa CBS 102226]|uniref:Uncharacterized protein n=1 Tax=Fonsecaea multimorphosa CBS 102226 TaxID=1442371 RepID=A0A0D2KAI6_9EURO|nr:uncharacterized protein Z520_01504 [Fonsecaea multimorphosa CBS 102226]KIY03038.1 hypothetical protein Z520_01504 [Fonsecaea multimorphosa CBS 102226]OAL30633.1 hypothetical protein AYO22_01485 [Fonsecaea multimorphosa]
MSMSLVHCLSDSVSSSGSFSRTFSRPFSISTSNFSASITSTKRPQRRSTSKSWLEDLSPRFFTDTPIYPDVLRIKPLTSNGAPPQDLSSLRPPPLPFIPPPQSNRNGRITLLQRLRYWWRRAAVMRKFYKQRIAQTRQNRKECALLSKRLPRMFVEHPDRAAIYGGSTFTVNDKSFPIPRISRREFQLLVQYGYDNWGFALAVRALPTSEKPEEDRNRQLKALCNRYDWFARNRNDKLDNVTDNSNLSHTAQAEEVFTLLQRRLLRWHYVVVDDALCKLIPWVPFAWTVYAARFFDRWCADYYRIITADTVLIMRQGGFNTLSADDIYDYCVKCASPTFISYAKQALQDGVNPANEAMRKAMIPVLDARAKRMLSIDWTRLKPHALGRIEPFSRVKDLKQPDSVWGRK